MYIYILAANNYKRKFKIKTITFARSVKNHKILQCKFNKGHTGPLH